MAAIYVTNTNDSGAGSLRAAVEQADTAAGADTIKFDSSLSGATITLTSGIGIDSDVKIIGDVNGDGKADITVSGGNASQIFFMSSIYADTTIRSLNMVDGYSAGTGGAVYVYGDAKLKVVNSTINNSMAARGGAIGTMYGDITIVNSLIWNNTGTDFGNLIFGGIGRDKIFGGFGNDIVDGGAGNDKLFGEAGNDFMKGGGSNDVVDGGTGDDTLLGGGGNDRLAGAQGLDTLTGNLGSDTFVLKSTFANRDTITDFNPVDDTLEISAAEFGAGLAAGALPAARFVSNTTGLAGDANDRFIYNSDTGELFFDSNGTGAGGSRLIATFSNHAALTAADILIV